MTTPPCPACGSTLGYYAGPNNKPRCLNCFHENPGTTEPDPSVSPEPNTQVDDKADPTPRDAKATVRDKAVRGPKEQATR